MTTLQEKLRVAHAAVRASKSARAAARAAAGTAAAGDTLATYHATLATLRDAELAVDRDQS